MEKEKEEKRGKIQRKIYKGNNYDKIEYLRGGKDVFSPNLYGT